jgi:hypothetical protein
MGGLGQFLCRSFLGCRKKNISRITQKQPNNRVLCRLFFKKSNSTIFLIIFDQNRKNDKIYDQQVVNKNMQFSSKNK